MTDTIRGPTEYANAILSRMHIFGRNLLKFFWREYSYPSQRECNFSLGYVFGMNFAEFISCPLHISNRSKQP